MILKRELHFYSVDYYNYNCYYYIIIIIIIYYQIFTQVSQHDPQT